MVQLIVADLSDVTLDHLRGVVGRTFHTRDLAGRAVDLRLVGVTDMRPRQRLAPDPPRSFSESDGALVATSALGLEEELRPVGPRRIGLMFQGPSERRLSDGVYDLELPWLPLSGLHLSPLEPAPDADASFYEAVIH